MKGAILDILHSQKLNVSNTFEPQISKTWRTWAWQD